MKPTQKPALPAPAKMPIHEVREIFVRAHTVIARKGQPPFPSPPKWPEEVLIFDTETTLDTAQKLNFAAYQRCRLGSAGYQCVEEGLFYADDLDMQERKVLERYWEDPRNIPAIAAKQFPPQMRLKLIHAPTLWNAFSGMRCASVVR